MVAPAAGGTADRLGDTAFPGHGGGVHHRRRLLHAVLGLGGEGVAVSRRGGGRGRVRHGTGRAAAAGVEDDEGVHAGAFVGAQSAACAATHPYAPPCMPDGG